MMSLKIAFYYSFIVYSLTHVKTQHAAANVLENSDPKFDVRVSELLAKNILQFAQEFQTTVLRESNNPAEIISPTSIYGALSMLLMGSKGQTFQKLMTLLKVNNDSYLANNPWKIHEEFGLLIEDLDRDFPNPLHQRPQLHRQSMRVRNDKRGTQSFQRISVANGIFIQNGYSIRPDYRNAIESAYKSTLQRLDFANKAALSTKYINRWVSEKTNGKIRDILPAPLHPLTKIVIASALYFNAVWEISFYEGSTRPQQFFPDGHDKPSITVEMMAQGGYLPFYESKEHDCRVIGLPYRRNLSTMFIILPNNSSRQRLREFQASITADDIHDMITKMEWKTSILLLPKLHVRNKFNLKEILNQMGLRALFEDGLSDLSLISSGEQAAANNLSSNSGESNPEFVHFKEDEDKFLFVRFTEDETNSTSTKNQTETRSKRSAVTYKASSDFHSNKEPLRLKDLVIGKRITKSYPRKKHVSRMRREIVDSSASLKRLDLLRSQSGLCNPRLFADDLIHQVDLTVNEIGTEGGAATVSTLRRSGPSVIFRTDAPFLMLIRHDDTKVPLFYGAVFEPTSN